jgi:cytochrome c biogenesis protein CcdA
MLRLIGLVVSIGLADSLNPSTVGPALYLASEEHPRRDVLQFTAGVAAVFFLGGAVLTLGPGQALLALVPHPGPTVRYIGETVAGAAMLVGAALLFRNRRRLGQRESEAPARRRASPLVLGLTLGVIELPTAFPYFAAIVAVIAAGLDPGSELFLIALYNLCFVLPLLAIVLTFTVARDRAQELLGRAREYLQRHWPLLLAVLALVAGMFVAALGVTGLTSGVHGRVGSLSRKLRHVISH